MLKRPATSFIQACRAFNPLKIYCLLNSTYKFSSYLTGNTLRLRYKAQPVNAVYGNSRCLLRKSYGTHKYTLWKEFKVLNVKAGGTYSYHDVLKSWFVAQSPCNHGTNIIHNTPHIVTTHIGLYLQIYTILVRTSQETHYVSATEPNRIMLFRETVAVYCESHTEHIYIHTNSVRTSQKTHYVTAT
jgi:hypothetical protein